MNTNHSSNANNQSSDDSSVTTMGDDTSVDLLQCQSLGPSDQEPTSTQSQIDATDGADLILETSSPRKSTTQTSSNDSLLRHNTSSPTRQCIVQYEKKRVYIGTFSDSKAKVVMGRYKELLTKWKLEGLDFSREELTLELERQGIRTLCRPEHYICMQEQQEHTTVSKRQRPLDEVPIIERQQERGPPLVSKENVHRFLSNGKFPLVPFCKKCNTSNSNAPYHHTLCPKHHEFDHSGAKEKMTVLLAGFRDGCLACSSHLTNGRKSPSLKHNDKCSDSAGIRKVNIMKELTEGKHNNETRFNAEEKRLSANSDRKEENEETCVPFVLDQNGERERTKLSRENIKNDKEPRAVHVITSLKTNGSDPSKVNPTRAGVTVSQQPNALNGSQNIVMSNFTTSTDDNSAAKWVSCPNPWGDHSHREGDSVLISPFAYKVANTSFSHASKRFVKDPFANSSNYHQSHFPPEFGCQVLQLTRDPSALRSWGFSFKYHELGGACLISDVEPLSPAGSAVIVGQHLSNNMNLLRPKDIIICLDGKKVGGMTDMDLEAELDDAGSEIILTVARCKIPKASDFCQNDVWKHIGLHWSESKKPIPTDPHTYYHQASNILSSKIKRQTHFSPGQVEGDSRERSPALICEPGVTIGASKSGM